ncbi:unnamed protein product [Penicillium pancosmium]
MESPSVLERAEARDFQQLEGPDQDIEEKLSNMYNAFQSKVDTMLRYTNEVLQICSASLAASNVRHIPITKRIKSWDSAKGSIRRQHHEHVLQRRLRRAVEARGRQWEDYCHEMGVDARGTETGAFQTPAEMFASLQDFGGMRISLYFPGDVERVASILQDHLQVIKVTNKRQGSGGRARRMQELIDYLQTPKFDKEKIKHPTTVTHSEQDVFSRTFSGYKATHFVVKLRDEDIPDDRRDAWKDVVVEIQVGTLVMHVWSEIEHDMIYKPLDSQGEGISNDEERLLDLINGIVLTGEAALQQLEASTAKRLDRRVSNKDAMASSYFELATWIEKDCEGLGIPLPAGEWCLLDRLYAILKAMDNHKHSEVTILLKAVATKGSSNRQTLPMAMLGALCRQSRFSDIEWPTFSGFTVVALAQNARLWAIRLVHTLNLAIYLGVGEAFATMYSQHPRPSLVSFLNILHPDCPRYSTAESAEVIAEFCRAMIDLASRPNPAFSRMMDAMDVARRLPRTNTVVSIAGSTTSHRLFVPDMICRILPISPKNSLEERELYRILDFMDFYVSRDSDKIDNHIDTWDRLMGRSTNNRCNSPRDQRYFVPRSSPHDKETGLWQRMDRPVQLEIVQLDIDDMNQANKEVRRGDFDNMTDVLDGVLELAYCLFPEDQHTGVNKAWNMAKALRPWNNPVHGHSGLPDLGKPPLNPGSLPAFPSGGYRAIPSASSVLPSGPIPDAWNSAPMYLSDFQPALAPEPIFQPALPPDPNLTSFFLLRVG